MANLSWSMPYGPASDECLTIGIFMSQTLDSAAMNAALKELYDNQTIENLVYNDNPFLAMVKKNTDFGGRHICLRLGAI